MCCSRPALFLWLACALVCQSYKFVELQEIFTNGAVKWEPFSMAGIQYIAVCNHFADSKIYKWDDAQSTFLEMQSIPTQGALGSTAFSMDGIQHLAIANSFDGSSYNIDSKVYKWDDTRSTFLEMQSIPTQGAWGWAAFSMDSIQHLAVANHFDGSSCNINSTIYKWDHATSTFLEMQSIPTSFARGWAAFSMDGIQHLAVANRYDGSSYNINSKVYKWDNASSTFLEMQSIPTKGAVGWTAFSMDGIQHLAVANERDSAGSHNVDSMIYKWDDTRSTFLEMQSISTKGTPAGWAAFSMDGIQHLAVGNYFDGSSNNLDSKVYRWDDTRSTFLEMQSIRTVGAWGWAAFSMDGIQHLALANRQDGDVRSWSLAALGGYLVRDPVNPAKHRRALEFPLKMVQATLTDHEVQQRQHPQQPQQMLYAMEAHQRAILVGYSAPCGAGTLMPLKRSQCPSTSEAIELPACHAFLVADKVCEADAEVDDGSCFVSKELDNCGDFDAYRMEQLACGAIGCKALSHILWVAALISFGATVGWNAGFYALRLRLQVHQPSRLQNRFVAFFAFLAVLLVTTIFVGFAGDSGAVLAMALLCPLLPVTAWALAAGFVFLPLQGQEAIESTGAALELPIFNVLVAFNLSVDDVERLNRDRTPLNMGLRVVEDIPELVIGLVDLVYFGGSWYAWFGILMSMAMLVFDLLLSVMLQCLQSALKIARKPRDRE
ncbi:TSPEAR [Symbiodinium sp. CCMP2592]|nr:TSPEAR [Symbiodinium sp. CCMP2592]